MARKFDHLADLEAYVTVVDSGSFSAAAIALATTPSVVSRAIARLENRVGIQLLRRTTRRLSLTEGGRVYVEQARAAFDLIDGAERRIHGLDGTITGRVRMSVPTTYGHFRLPPLLAGFSEKFPQVRVDLSIANRNVDLVGEGYDLAVRLGKLSDSGLVGRKLEDAGVRLVASPAYLQRAGVPDSIDALASHACLPFVMPGSGKVAPWLLREHGQDRDYLPSGKVMVSDDVLGTVSLAESGLGICQAYDFVVQEKVNQGRLVECLPDARGRGRPFSVIFPPHQQLSAAARALIDWLCKHSAPGPATQLETEQ